jgi:NAD-dependent DNA ligase
MPSEGHYDWNETGVDIILTHTSGHRDVEMSKIIHFMKTLGIKHFGEAAIQKLYDIGLTSVPLLIRNINAATLVRELDGVKETLANKLVESLRNGVQSAQLIDLAAGSGVFGRGFASKKLAAAFAVVLPKIREERVNIERRGHVSREIVDIVESVSGFSNVSAENFGNCLPEFVRFLTEIGQIDKLFSDTNLVARAASSSDSSGSSSPHVFPQIFTGKTFLFTGFRDKDLADKLVVRGANIADSFVKSVTDLVIPDETTTNTKIEKARSSGTIRIHIRNNLSQQLM